MQCSSCPQLLRAKGEKIGVWPTAVDVADGLEFSKAWDRQKGGKAQTPKGLGVGRRMQECSLVSKALKLRRD